MGEELNYQSLHKMVLVKYESSPEKFLEVQWFVYICEAKCTSTISSYRTAFPWINTQQMGIFVPLLCGLWFFFCWRIIFVTLLHTLWIITWLKDLGGYVGISAGDVKKEFSVLLPRCCHYRAFWVCFSEHKSLEQDLASPVGAAGFIRPIALQFLGISGGWRNTRERDHREGSSLSPPIFCHYMPLKKHNISYMLQSLGISSLMNDL